MQKKIMFREHPDGSQRVYFTRVEIAPAYEQGLRGSGDAVQNSILEMALEVPGVVIATVGPYSLGVVKVPTYEWSEIHPSIERLIQLVELSGDSGRLEDADERADVPSGKVEATVAASSALGSPVLAVQIPGDGMYMCAHCEYHEFGTVCDFDMFLSHYLEKHQEVSGA